MYHVSTTILVSNPPADNRSEQPGPFEYSSIKARRSERNFGICRWKLKNPLNWRKFSEGIPLILLRSTVAREGKNQ